MIARIAAIVLATGTFHAAAIDNLMPVPTKISPAAGALPVDADFTIAIEGEDDDRI